MTTLRKAMPILLFCAALLVCLPLAAQTQDCSFTYTFIGDGTYTVSNLSNVTPCVNWRITLSVTGSLTTTATFYTSPDNSTFTAVPNTVCSATVQPPCILQGANPIVGTQGMIYVAAYGAFVRVVTSSSSGTGNGTIRGYGVKGASAAALPFSGSGGGGTVTTVGFTGGIISVANPTTTPAFTVAGTSGGIPYFSSASTWASSGALTQYFAILGGGAGNPPTVSTIKDDGTAVTINQNSVVPFTSVTAGAIANTLYLVGGKVGIGMTGPTYGLDVSRGVGLAGTARFFDQTPTTGTTLVTITPGAAQIGTSVVLNAAAFMQAFGFVADAAAGDVVQFLPTGFNKIFGGDAILNNVGGGAMTFYGTGLTFRTAGTDPALLIDNTTGRLEFKGASNSFPGFATSAINGFAIQSAAGTTTYNDAVTAGSGTVALRDLFLIAAPTMTATNTLVTYTNTATLHLGLPVASTNVTFTNPAVTLLSDGPININWSSFLFNGHTCTIVATVVTCP